jgi:predicted GNAT family N-acyltransferase
MLDDFIRHIKEAHNNSEHKFKDVKVVLSSVETAVTFYETYGFRWTREPLTDHPTLMRYEKYEENKEYFILELSILS